MSLANDIWDFISSSWRSGSRQPHKFKQTYTLEELRSLPLADLEFHYCAKRFYVNWFQDKETSEYTKLYRQCCMETLDYLKVIEPIILLKRSQEQLKPKIKKAKLLRRRSAIAR